MTDFVRGACPIWLLDDLTGNLLDDTYYVFFLENTLPYLPQGVYRDFAATVPWDNPLQVQADGTLPNNLYFDPAAVYRIEIRHGNTQADALIRLVENYVPLGEEPTPVDDTNAHVENLMTNPQFFDVNFQTDVTFQSTSTITQIAPGWEIEKTAGVTTVTVAQLSFPGDNNVATNASYALSITSAGTGTIILRQKFDNTGGLFASGAVTLALTAAYSGTVVDLHAELVYSAGTAPTEIFNPVKTLTTTLTEYTGHSDVPVSANPDTAANAYTALELSWASGATVKITSVQLVATPSGSTQEISYQQVPLERQVDHEFHYFKSQLIQKPIPSWLVGWDFPLNPSQFVGNGSVSLGAIGGNKGAYVWDQTIAFQTVDNTISVSREASKALILGASNATQGAILQYLDNTNGTVQALLEGALAVNVYCKCNSGDINCTVSLWYTTDATLPNVAPVSAGGTNSTFITALGANGKPSTVSGNWAEIPRINNLGDAIFAPNSSFSSAPLFQDYSFNGWSLEGDTAINSATFFAIVIGTSSLIAGDNVVFKSVGLMTGDIGTRPAPQTPAQVLQDCQRYYESSYLIGTNPGTATATPGTPGMITSMQLAGQGTGAGNTAGYAGSFEIIYQTPKRLTPTLSFYSPVSGTLANIYYFLFNDGVIVNENDATLASFWALGSSSTKATYYKAANGTRFTTLFGSAPDIPEAFISYHYTADSRLGIVN